MAILMIKHLIILSLAGAIYLTQVVAADYVIGSNEILQQWTFGSKRELLIELLWHSAFAGLLLLISYILIQGGYRFSRMPGRLLIVVSILVIYFVAAGQFLLTLMLTFSLLIALILSRGFKL